MAYTTINKSTDYFRTKLYTGNGSARSITFDESSNMQPDFIWLKSRDHSYDHRLLDAVRGATKELNSNTSNSEGTNTGSVTSFNTNGFSLGTDNGVNNPAPKIYVTWNWKAGGTASGNSDGTISSTVSVNTTAGFSIVAYTGNGTGNSTIGHGLGATPNFIIVKRRDSTGNWGTYNPAFVSASDPNILYLDVNNAQADDTNVFGTSATFNNNTFTVGDWNGSNVNYGNYIAYCFAEKTGYSKFGSYTGNGNADGTFVYTGFKPAWLMIKRTDSSDGWIIFDNKRSSFNVVDKNVQANSSNTETDYDYLDFLSNGFKIRMNGASANGSGASYIYMAFGQSLVGSNNIPATAR